MKYLLIFILPLAFILSSCGLSDSEPEPSTGIQRTDLSDFVKDMDSLPGSWEWTQSITYGRSSGNYYILTSEQADFTRQLTITDETITSFKNGDMIWSQNLESYLRNHVWGIKDDTLIVSSMHRDGSENTYVRIN